MIKASVTGRASANHPIQNLAEVRDAASLDRRQVRGPAGVHHCRHCGCDCGGRRECPQATDCPAPGYFRCLSSIQATVAREAVTIRVLATLEPPPEPHRRQD